MTLIIETGSIVPNANSYVTVAEVRAYADERGISLPAGESEVEAKVFMAMDWFEGHPDFIGRRVSAEQTLSWPRYGAMLNGFPIDSESIPDLVKRCVIQATCDAVTIELQPSYAGTTTGNIKRKKLDVMEKEFFEPTWASQTPRLDKLMGMIGPLINGGLASGRLTTVRV